MRSGPEPERHVTQIDSRESVPWWTFRIFFIFFRLGGGEGGVRGARKGRGSVFY